MDNLIVLSRHKHNGLNHFFNESLYSHFQNTYICAPTSSIMKIRDGFKGEQSIVLPQAIIKLMEMTLLRHLSILRISVIIPKHDITTVAEQNL